MLAVSVWVILAPLLAAQYLLAVLALYLLYKRPMYKGARAAWNVVILLVFFLGGIAYIVYHVTHPPKA